MHFAAVHLYVTDKGKAGTKRHLVADRGGIPLAVVLSAANIHDSRVLEEAVDAIEPIKGLVAVPADGGSVPRSSTPTKATTSRVAEKPCERGA